MYKQLMTPTEFLKSLPVDSLNVEIDFDMDSSEWRMVKRMHKLKLVFVSSCWDIEKRRTQMYCSLAFRGLTMLGRR